MISAVFDLLARLRCLLGRPSALLLPFHLATVDASGSSGSNFTSAVIPQI